MIDWINQAKPLTREDREKIFDRALITSPYFYQFNFSNSNPGPLGNRYETKEEIAFDYFVTGINANTNYIGVSATDRAKFAIFDSVDDKGWYGLPSRASLPISFQTYNAKWDDTQALCDIQEENITHRVKRGSRIIAQIEPDGGPVEGLKVCLHGYTAGMRNHYLNDSEQQLIEASLNSEVTYDLFRFDLDFFGETKILRLENDRFPRLVLAMGARLWTSRPLAPFEIPPKIAFKIEDFDWQIKLTNEKINLEFLAPCPPRSLDESYYYWPTEYYISPFNTLNFETTIDTPSYGPDPIVTKYEFYVLTRTV